MELAVAALGSLLPKLAKLLTDEYKLQKGVKGEIRFLHAEMESMQAVLNRVSKLPAHQIDDLLGIWVRDLKELSYDIEDSADSFMLQVEAPGWGAKRHGFRKFFDRTIGLLTKAKARHHIADDIQDIKQRIHEVADRRQRYKFEDIVVQPDDSTLDPRLPAVYEEVKNLVGVDGPTEKIINLMMHGADVQKQQKLMVVSIVGVGGLGKTTLANSVYQRLRGEFQSQAFVSVSLKPDIKKILSSILRQVSRKQYPNAEEWNQTELIDEIRKDLEEKRYIIIIDDVWGKPAWAQIKCALLENNLGSRVIVTTRNLDVAKFSCSSIDDTMYELDPLSDEDSKRLLCKRLFTGDEEIHSELEEVSQKILRKCGGVPLAIITTASLLASTPNKSRYEWYRVYESMGSGLEKDKTMENMREILYLSYRDLPSCLKPCLLSLSMFPEDHEITVRELVCLWVADGFVTEKQGSNLYGIGGRYFMELVNRSMIQPQYINEIGEVISCRVHDMILDLAISLSVQENFATIAFKGSQLLSQFCKLRRLSLQGGMVSHDKKESKEEQEILTETVNVSRVRSLLVFGDASRWMQPLPRFSVLRVLSLEHISSKNMQAKDLGRLQFLRYLRLRGKIETGLLEEIGNLQLLRTLDLMLAFIKDLPASIVQLRNLEHLLVGTGVKFPEGIDKLIRLQQLGSLGIEASPSILAELSSLIELRTLAIHGLQANKSYMETLLQSLSNLDNLNCLELEGNTDEICCLDCKPAQWRGPARLQHIHGEDLTLSRVPRWFSTLSELTLLSICVNLLRQEDLQLLGALPLLRFLKLEVDPDGTAEERLVVGADQPFRSLTEFKFKHDTGCCLVLGQGVMPKLQRLKLHFQALKREDGSLDTCLGNLGSLKHIKVKVNCRGARISDVEDVETKIRQAIDTHPNHPTLALSRKYEGEMISDDSEESKERS